MTEFKEFRKIPRLCRECIITEKIDGTNGVIFNGEDGEFLVGSRSRWLEPGKDNFGFLAWATEHKAELIELGAGYHYGEWWGPGIQRGYGIKERRWSLFNVKKWGYSAPRPSCCDVVQVLASGIFSTELIDETLKRLSSNGSMASPGFMRPEGIVIYHVAAGTYFKKTIDKDDEYKSSKTHGI